MVRFKFIVVSYTGKLLGQESDRAGKWDSDEWGCEVQAETGKHTVGPQVNCFATQAPPTHAKFISLELCYMDMYLHICPF